MRPDFAYSTEKASSMTCDKDFITQHLVQHFVNKVIEGFSVGQFLKLEWGSNKMDRLLLDYWIYVA